MDKKIILGIHGVGNKPPRRILKLWWKNAINEGLQRIGQSRLVFHFELVYWARFLHRKPLDIKLKDQNNPLYVKHPYVMARSEVADYTPNKFKIKLLNYFEKILDRLSVLENSLLNFDIISNFVIRNKFKDLDLYYHPDGSVQEIYGQSAKEAICQQLAGMLKKYQHCEILLIAHSMGCIVAYDVLTQIVPDLKIHTFITMGSPLGLPVIMKKILEERQEKYETGKKVPTPENIKKAWVNVSDLDDRITINYALCDDYEVNSHGVGPVDHIVHNDYEYEGIRDPHAAYGYLRTPEVAKVIYDFLIEREFEPFVVIKRWTGNIISRVKEIFT